MINREYLQFLYTIEISYESLYRMLRTGAGSMGAVGPAEPHRGALLRRAGHHDSTVSRVIHRVADPGGVDRGDPQGYPKGCKKTGFFREKKTTHLGFWVLLFF